MVSRGLPKGAWKKVAKLAMRAAVFRWGDGRAEVGCGSSAREKAGRVRRETPNVEARLPTRGARRVWSGGRENALRQAQEDRADVGASATA